MKKSLVEWIEDALTPSWGIMMTLGWDFFLFPKVVSGRGSFGVLWLWFSFFAWLKVRPKETDHE